MEEKITGNAPFAYKIENLHFSYPNEKCKALENINITIEKGSFVTLCGKSGCGKTTLLRLLKPPVAPSGTAEGKIYFENKLLSCIDERGQVEKIGYVMQDPDNQIVTDKVWHELAFGLESLGYSTAEIRARVSEMASFFGIQTWFLKKVTELSGGQKQLLNLASVMAMQPSVLILDEPTSRLDPIAAQSFFDILGKINKELGTTILLSEHRLEETFQISDKIIVMENGKIICDEKPRNVGKILKSMNNDMYSALPTPMRVYGLTDGTADYPLNVCEGRCWLEKYNENHTAQIDKIPTEPVLNEEAETAIELKDVWFRYEKKSPDVIKGLNFKAEKGKFFAIVGGNGTGKTTALSLIAGINKPYRGKITLNGNVGLLPQNPQALFVKKTLALDLEEILKDKKMTKGDIDKKVSETAELCKIKHLLNRHPYDLSGGEQQRAALAKVLLQNPRILLLDEPTKGMDAAFKEEFAQIIKRLNANGVTVAAVSHDIEFCAEYADKCAMFFDGAITSEGLPREFFAGKSFYTTSANRMARGILPQAVVAKDIVAAYGGEMPTKCEKPYIANTTEREESSSPTKKEKKPIKFAMGCVFAIIFIFTEIFKNMITAKIGTAAFQIIAIAECAVSLGLLLPTKKATASPSVKIGLKRKGIISSAVLLIAVAITIYTGIYLLDDKKYYFISLMIILETTAAFCATFESRKPQAKELVTVSVLCAIAVAGRTAFYMLPEFKASAAVIIISGVCLGAETGFLTGAVTGFVSNFFFGQGPWTPWQMFGFGMLGLLAGIIFNVGFVKKEKISLCIFGFISVFLVYGTIMNTATVVMTQPNLNFKLIAAACASGVPFDFVHALSTAFFLWFAAEPMMEKTERIKTKYGLMR